MPQISNKTPKIESVIGEKMRRQKLFRSTFCLITRVLVFPVTVANSFTHNLWNLSEGFDSYLLDLVCPQFFLQHSRTRDKL